MQFGCDIQILNTSSLTQFAPKSVLLTLSKCQNCFRVDSAYVKFNSAHAKHILNEELEVV